MSTGIIGYLSARGLGTMTHDLRQQLDIRAQIVVPDEGWPYQVDWATGKELYLEKWTAAREDIELWRDYYGINTLVSIETSYGDNTFRWAKELGMRTILIVMWEAFNPNMAAYKNVDLYICPSFKAYQEIPFDNKVFLPYPVDTDLFQYRQRTGVATEFIHNAGSGGMNGRKGTTATILAFSIAKQKRPHIELTVRSQVGFDTILPDVDCIDVTGVYFEGGRPNREDLYTDGDVLIYPSKYDGHALVSLEGMASGMPVITTDAAPMNEFWRPQESELLVRVEHQEKPNGLVNPHCMSECVDIDDLAAKIVWAADNDMSEISARNRAIVEKEHSWNALKGRWAKVLESR